MNGLNYHHLFYFWTVAREGSIARATRKLHLTQPTISAQIRHLERRVGEPLFQKRGRGLVMTEMGEVVYRYAEEIFSLGRELMETVQGRPTGRPLRFAVGISDALPKLTTYRLLQPALALGDAIRPVLRIGKTEQLLADLALHTLDVVLADAPAPPGVSVRVFSHPVGESDVTVFGVPELADRYRDGFPGSLEGAPFLLHTGNTALRQSLERWFADQGLRPRVAAEVEDVALLQVLGQHGLGLFAAPTVVQEDIRRAYGVEVVAGIPDVVERFYAISADRRLTHPAVVALSRAGRGGFGTDEDGEET